MVMYESSTQETPPKRRKTTLACDECRDRKRKCDGVRPVCGGCAKRTPQLTCVFEDDRTKSGWGKSYVESLHARIKELETPLHTTQTPTDTRNHQTESLAVLAPAMGLNTIDDHLHSGLRPSVGVTGITRRSEFSSPFNSNSANVLPSATHASRASVQITTPQQPPEQFPMFADRTPKSSTSNVFESRQSAVPGNGTDPNNDDTNSESEDDGIDAMGSASANLIHDAMGNRQARTAYFGLSSTVTFMSYLQNAIGKSTGRSPTFKDASESQSDIPLDNEQSQRHRRGGVWETTSEEGMDMNPMEFCLPFRNQADSLLQSYWVSVWSLYPFLHKATFLARYAKVWESTADDRSQSRSQGVGRKRSTAAKSHDKLFYCTLNAVFALGCSFHPDLNAHDRVSMSSIYFKRAKRLMTFDILEKGSLQLVQTLLLVSQYLQSTEMVGSCWNLVGLAIRVAQGLGIHIAGHESVGSYSFTGGKRPANQMQVEVTRRVWGGCVFLDRILSMTYGRPSMLSPAAARSMVLPSIIDDEFLTTDPERPGSQPIGVRCQMAFFVHALKLQEVLGQILTALYAGTRDQPADPLNNHGESRTGLNCDPYSLTERFISGDFQTILTLDASLTKWHRDLPPELRIETKAPDIESAEYGGSITISEDPQCPEAQLFVRQRNILYARYLHIRILLFRPFLLALLSCDQDTTVGLVDNSLTETILAKTFLAKISSSCVEAAQNLVDLIGDCEDCGSSALPAWWYNVFYVYTCAIVLLAARLCASTEAWAVKSKLARSWERSLRFLKKYQTSSRQAKNCYKVLQLIDIQFRDPRHGLESSNSRKPQTSAYTQAANMASSTQQSALGPDSLPMTEYPPNGDFGGAQPMDGEIPNSNECFSLENFYDGNGLSAMRESLDMAWLTSMPMNAQTDGIADMDGTFECGVNTTAYEKSKEEEQRADRISCTALKVLSSMQNVALEENLDDGTNSSE